MTVSHTPAPARSDLGHSRPSGDEPTGARPYLLHGLLLSGGALTWAVGMVLFGLDPQTAAGEAGYSAASGLFQLGLLALLRVLWQTNALGTGKIAKAVIMVETVLVGLAIGSTLADGIGVSDLSQPAWALLDACWPFSMLGMFIIGIRIAIAGRWHGVRRFWPMVAESWALVTIPSLMIFGSSVAAVVAPLHLLVGYVMLGLLVATASTDA